MSIDSLDIATLRRLYTDGAATPLDVVETVLARCAVHPDRAVWISRPPDEAVRAAAKALMARRPTDDQPLWGIPFAVKDNIDCARLPTTAACPAFAYQATEDAHVVAKLRAAGAILIGKTNLDQFATGLNGTRSPYGSPRSVFNAGYVSGGSSSGSAVAVASGLVSFALGSDTAGSGRVPAAFNNLIGIKPTKGLLSNTGGVPACRSLDCISILALTAGDGSLVRQVAEGHDPADAFSRIATPTPLPMADLRIGVLRAADREFCGDMEYAALYAQAIEHARAQGARIVEFDYAPFRETAALLYGGAWAAERLAAIESFASAHADAIEPTVRGIILGARSLTAVETFRGQYMLQALKARAEAEWRHFDVMLLPSAPTTYTVEAMLADPIRLNANLGLYTNFVNLLDYAAVALPAGFRSDGIPFGVTLVGRAFQDQALALLADRLHRARSFGMGKDVQARLPEPAMTPPDDDGRLSIFVIGAHLSGMPLNHELTIRNAVLQAAMRTAPGYRFYALAGAVPPKPGLIAAPGFSGPGIEGEVWRLDAAGFGSFVAAIPQPLGIGKITLEDGSQVPGFLCEAHALEGATEITHFGGWRAYRASLARPLPQR
jgi:allophanate hydrolase